MAAKARAGRPAARATAVAVPRTGRRPGARILARSAPSRRSLAVGLGILALAIGAYAVARGTSLFAIRTLAIRGGSPQVDAQVEHALAPLVGTSLVGLDGAAVERRVEALPTVVSVTFDRAFPNTLQLAIVPERPVAVLRRGPAAWLVSARGRVMMRLKKPEAHPHMPRVWLASRVSVTLGELLPPATGGAAARAVGLAGAFAARVASASDSGGALVFRLRSGIDLRLGAAGGIRLKVAVSRRALRVLPAGTTYLDVSVPGHPVAGAAAQTTQTNSQVSTGALG